MSDPRAVRRAHRRAQDALRRAAVTGRVSKPARQELGNVAGGLRRALGGNGRYTPPKGERG